MTDRNPRLLFLLLGLLLHPSLSMAMPLGHHGGLVIQCKDPRIDEESPAPETHLERLEALSFLASQNTDPLSIKVRINVEPVPHTLTRERNGDYRIHVVLQAPITEGRAWIKVTAMSDDGCDKIHTWNVYVDRAGKTP